MKDIIPQCNPLSGYIAHKEEIDAALETVLHSGQYVLGEQVRLFEREFAVFVNTNYCIGVASGTDAIELALRACGTAPQDVVFVPSHTAVATVAAIERAGGIPFLIEIDEHSFTMSPLHLEAAVAAVKMGKYPGYCAHAVVPVHLYGHPANMPAIMEIASRQELMVIEDCAQAHGAAINNRKVGTWGNMGAFSFYPTKNLCALGDGGAVTTDDNSLAEKIFGLRQYGWEKKRESLFSGINSRLDELQAAILRIRLKYLNEDNRTRIEIAERYMCEIQQRHIILPQKPRMKTRHVYHQFVIRCLQRDRLFDFLMHENIATAIHYPKPVHLQPAYCNRLPMTPKGLPITEKICREILSLPMYPELTKDQVGHVCEVLNRFNPF